MLMYNFMVTGNSDALAMVSDASLDLYRIFAEYVYSYTRFCEDVNNCAFTDI